MGALSKHAGAVLVAVLFLALALLEGGFDSKALSAATVVVWWVVIVGLFVRVWPGSEAPRAAVACGGALAALGALSALSLIWADDAGRAFDEVVRIAGYLGLFVLAVLASRRGSAASWAGGLAAGFGALAALALLSRFEPGLLTSGAGDLAAEIPSAAGRLAYPLGYWNGLGACMALAVVVLAWTAWRARGPIARASAAGALALPVLAIYLADSLGAWIAAAVGLAVLIAASGQRFSLVAAIAPGLVGGALLVWLASMRDALVGAIPGPELRVEGDEMLAITIGIVALTGAARHLLDGQIERLRGYRIGVSRPILLGGIALLLVAALVAADPVQRWDDFEDPGALAEPPSAASASLEAASASAAGNGRYQWWSASLDGWAEDPLTGLGAGNWQLYWNANGTLPVFTQHAHSLFFEVFAELGIAGLLAVLAFFGAAIAAGVGRRRSSRGEVAVWLGVVATGLVSALGEWTWQIPAAAVPLIIAAAVLTGPATLRPEWPRPVRGAQVAAADAPRRPPGFGLGVATMLTGFACIWIAGVALLSTVQLDEARSAVAAGDYDEAARNARYAGAIEPWSPEPRIELAGAEALRGRLAEARDAAEDAVDLTPGDYRTRVVLARILARQGEREAAEEELARANELSPLPLPVELPVAE